MNICHVLYGLTIGGIETMLVNIANCQQKAGHKVTVIIVNDLIDNNLLSSIDKTVGVRLIKRPIGSKNPYYILKTNWIFSNVKPDVIHIHKANILRFILPQFRSRVCVTQHELILDDDIEHIAKIAHRYSISQAVADDLKTMTQLDSIVVENGIDLTAFEHSTTSYTPHKPLKCVTVGRLEHIIKGQDTLIEACKILSRNTESAFHLDIIGDGSSRQYLLDLIRDDQLTDQVSLLGALNQGQLSKSLKNYDLFILPSNFEGFGISVIEAMAAGLPVLVSDLPALKQITLNGKCGYLFKKGDPQSCAEAINNIYNNGIDTEMLNLQKKQVKQYDIQETASKYIKLYENQGANCK